MHVVSDVVILIKWNSGQVDEVRVVKNKIGCQHHPDNWIVLAPFLRFFLHKRSGRSVPVNLGELSL